MTDTEGTEVDAVTSTATHPGRQSADDEPSHESVIDPPDQQRHADVLQPADGADDDAETFSRDYVEKLRRENGRYRQRAGETDALAQRLHIELVRATGRLADPTDLPFDAAHLDDPDTLAAAVDDLLAAKPHLASRRPVGDIGQGQRGSSAEPFSLLGALKAHT